jgi:hypothetical protein
MTCYNILREGAGETNSYVKPFLGQINSAVQHDQLHLDICMDSDKLAHQRSNAALAESDRDTDAQKALRFGSEFTEHAIRISA